MGGELDPLQAQALAQDAEAVVRRYSKESSLFQKTQEGDLQVRSLVALLVLAHVRLNPDGAAGNGDDTGNTSNTGNSPLGALCHLLAPMLSPGCEANQGKNGMRLQIPGVSFACLMSCVSTGTSSLLFPLLDLHGRLERTLLTDSHIKVR